ncbi:pyridoxamine 5'-phosphate oxidase family protein [Paenibacillus sp. Aloe-11]|uniref:pyridoxamine 5'-phosphate oxidase family protein n=1 Tax=Paenibacillus sp. Aloe-11 TaxID=1050222 RepID=UPI00024EF681|nr:pyridoxamine 5'-phosphate oxidase family protein [Paenibacillus sp. Aloe-11]EHS55039.1 hypothetical protein WG8_5071 [Paenibacillus sp. Aloe-11]
MSNMQGYYEILEETNRIALATSVDNIPSVRNVNFAYDTNRPGIIYFTSDRRNQKVVEFGKNNKVAFTTIPTEGIPHVRSHHAMVEKSKYSIDEVKELFLAKVPGYDEILSGLRETLEVFEIQIKEATIILGYDQQPSQIRFE